MNTTEIINITQTLNQFNNAFEISGLSQIQDTLSSLTDSINCSFKPIIELSEQWNKTQEELFGSLKPALDNISEFSNTIRNIPSLNTSISSDLLDAFEKYNDVASPCLYTSSEIIFTPIIDSSDEAPATKEDVQNLRFEVERLHKDIIFLKREKYMNPNEFSDEAEYIYNIIYNHYINGTISNHALMINSEEFSEDLSDSSFELGLEELESQRFISDYKSYIDSTYHVELCLRCTKALKEGKKTLSEPILNIISEQRPAVLIQVMTEYPQFEKDYEILLSNKYFEKTETGLHWLKKKQCLAEYFGDQKFPNKWILIEKLFNETGLKPLYNNKEYESKDYQQLKELLKL